MFFREIENELNDGNADKGDSTVRLPSQGLRAKSRFWPDQTNAFADDHARPLCFAVLRSLVDIFFCFCNSAVRCFKVACAIIQTSCPVCGFVMARGAII
jgi:hypothetical protein